MRANVSIGVSVATAVVLAAGTPAGPGWASPPEPGQQDTAGETRGVTAEQFDRWMTELSNWGRWGNDDELGTLNLITPAKRIQAAALVTAGVSVSLSRSLVLGENVTFQRGFDNVFAFGLLDLRERTAWIEEQHRIGYHASPLTHLDALCHVAWDGMTYNGRRFDEMATVESGCTQNGVAPLKPGIVTRGILMDMPGPNRVAIDDIETWEQQSGITISAGDALFLRTAGQGGFDNSVMPFLKERDLAMLIADTRIDGGPVEGRTTLPMHVFTLVALGMPLIDSVDLEALAETAATVNRWEFMFVVAPLPVDNGAGSAVNPVAIF